MTGPNPLPESPVDQVVMMCGLAGSGKTTLSLRLQEKGYRRFSFDERAWDAGFRRHPVDQDVAESIHRGIDAEALEAVAAGIPVVIDTSFWSRRSRDRIRELFAPLGIVPVVYYVHADPEERQRRLDLRADSGPNDVHVPEELRRRYVEAFEVPTRDEGPIKEFLA